MRRSASAKVVRPQAGIAGLMGSASETGVLSTFSFLLPRVCCLLPAICCLLPSACCLLSAVCCLLSSVCCLLSAAYCLLSAACCLLSAVCCLLSTICCLLSAVCCLLSAVCWPARSAHQRQVHLLVSFLALSRVSAVGMIGSMQPPPSPLSRRIGIGRLELGNRGNSR
jgi:hypothetical protein